MATDPQIRIRGRDDTKAAFASVTSSLRSLKASAAGLQGLFAGIVAGFSVTQVIGSFKSVIDAADEVNKSAQKIGVTTEALSGLQYAAKLAGVSSEELRTSMGRLAKNASETAAGTGEAKDAFAALKINVVATGGGLKDTDELLGELADKFAGMADNSQKTALAIKIFGRAGAELIPLLNNGRKGIEELRKEAERLGLVLDKETAQAAEDFNDDMERVRKSVEGIQLQILRGLLPVLDDLTNEFRAASVEGDKWREMGQDIGEIFKTVAQAAVWTVGLVKAMGNTLGGVAAVASAVLRGDLAGARQIAREFYEENKRIDEEIKRRQEIIENIGKPSEIDLSGIVTVTGWSKITTKPPAILDQEAIKKAAQELRKLREEEIKQLVKAVDDLQEESDALIYTWDGFGQRVAMTRKEFEAIEEENRKLAEHGLKDQLDAIDRMLEASDELVTTWVKIGETWERIQLPRAQWEDDLKQGAEWAKDLGQALTGAFADAIVEARNWADVVKGLIKDVLRVILQELVIKKVSGGILNILGTVFPSIAGKQTGGRLNAGEPVVVGEAGRELFVPDSGGTLISNKNLGMGGVTVNVNIATGVSATVRSELAQMIPAIQRATTAGVADARLRGQMV